MRDTHTDQREGETMAGVLTVSCRAVSSNLGYILASVHAKGAMSPGG